MKKLLWVKFGWSKYYRGGPVDGNFGWLNDHRGKKNEGRGHEALNFMPAANGIYYCYVPPQGKGKRAPWNESNTGWTVVCLAKNPRRKGIHVVGWYENATLIGNWQRRPLQSDGEPDDVSLPYDFSYCITSRSAFFISPEHRSAPFSDTSVRRGKFSFLAGPDIEATPNKLRVLKILENRLASFLALAVHGPNDSNASDPELDLGDPLIGFGTPEHRKRVELAAEQAVVGYYENNGYKKRRVAHLNCGYDFVFKKGRTEHHVEVKGTSAANARLFLTRNEYGKYRSDPKWRLGMVTNALDKHPSVALYDTRKFKKEFDLDPYVFIGERIVESKDD